MTGEIKFAATYRVKLNDNIYTVVIVYAHERYYQVIDYETNKKHIISIIGGEFTGKAKIIGNYFNEIPDDDRRTSSPTSCLLDGHINEKIPDYIDIEINTYLSKLDGIIRCHCVKTPIDPYIQIKSTLNLKDNGIIDFTLKNIKYTSFCAISKTDFEKFKEKLINNRIINDESFYDPEIGNITIKVEHNYCIVLGLYFYISQNTTTFLQ